MENWKTKDTAEIGSEITKKVDDYRNYCQSSGLSDLWDKSYRQYYSGYFFGGDLKRHGDQGEMMKSSVNHFRNILQHILTMATSQRLQFDPQSINTDFKSMAQTVLAKNLLAYYMRAEKIEQFIKEAAENALVFGEGYLYSGWDYSIGENIAENVKAGDMFFRYYTPRDVVRDTSMVNVSKYDWYILIDYVNRFELANKYPARTENIMNANRDTNSRYTQMNSFGSNVDQSDETIELFTFVHRKSASLPNGRIVECIADGTCLFDGDMEYKEFPVSSIVPSAMKDIPFGYTIGYDLLPLQISHDGVYSSIVTNQNAFGVQNVLVPNNSDISVNEISDGLNFINYNSAAGEPKPLNLLSTPKEMYSFLDMINNLLQVISGVNSVSRGQPEASLKSGAALALVQSMAIQFNSAFQNAYAFFCESVGTSIVTILQKYAKTPRVALISGKSNQSYLKEFTGDDISNITRVVVDMGNPLQRTTAGRVAMADALLEKGMVKTPEEYIQVIETGRLEPLIENERNELMLIKSENEQLMQGINPPVMVTDNHPLHIKEHCGVTASADMRTDATVVQAQTEHNSMHIEQLRTADPSLLAILGIQSIAPSQPIPGDASASMPMDGSAMPQQPNMPTNPLSGEEFNQINGGLNNA